MGIGGEEVRGIFIQCPAGHHVRGVLWAKQSLSSVFVLGLSIGSDGNVNWPWESETQDSAWWTWGVLPALCLRLHLP